MRRRLTLPTSPPAAAPRLYASLALLPRLAQFDFRRCGYSFFTYLSTPTFILLSSTTASLLKEVFFTHRFIWSDTPYRTVNTTDAAQKHTPVQCPSSPAPPFEIGMVALNDFAGNYVHSCAKLKLSMRGGETDILSTEH